MPVNLISRAWVLLFILNNSLLTPAQRRKLDDRWVWRRIRSPQASDLTDPFNSFGVNDPSIFSTLSRGNIAGRTQSGSRFIFSPSSRAVSLHDIAADGLDESETLQPAVPSSVFRSTFNPKSDDIDPGFSLPPQLGRPVSLTLPSSNHLQNEPEVEISSYSSLDANPRFQLDLDLVDNRKQARSLSKSIGDSSANLRNGLEPINITPLPIDISVLPLESNERAEGIKKLWSSIMSRKEFISLFDSLTSTSRPISNIPVTNPENVNARPIQSPFNHESSPLITRFQFPDRHQHLSVPIVGNQRHQQTLFTHTNPKETIENNNQDSVSLFSFQEQGDAQSSSHDQNQSLDQTRTGKQVPQSIHFFNLNNPQNDRGDPEQVGAAFPQPPPTRISIFNHPSSRTPIQPAAVFSVAADGSDDPTVGITSEPSQTLDQNEGLVQTTLHLPQRSDSFIVRKLRLPGNNVANVVFIPSASAKAASSPEDITQSSNALKFFRQTEVQQAIKERNKDDTIFVVEETVEGADRNYIVTTAEGRRVYPPERLNTFVLPTDNIEDSKIFDGFFESFSESSGSSKVVPKPAVGLPAFINRNIHQGSDIRKPLTTPDLIGTRDIRSPLTRGTLVHSHRVLGSGRVQQNSKHTSFRTGKILTTNNEEQNSNFSPIDEFDPENFNPFIPNLDDKLESLEEFESSSSKRSVTNIQSNPNALYDDFENSLPKGSKAQKFFSSDFGFGDGTSTWLWPNDFNF